MDENRIRQRAREIWEREGRPEGRDEEFRNRARLELADEEGSRSGTGGGTGWPMPYDPEALHGENPNPRGGERRDIPAAKEPVRPEDRHPPRHAPGAEEESGGGA